MSEKLTIVPPLTIRMTESMAHDITALADLRGMEKSEYIRHLVAQDKLEQRRIWVSRNPLFAHEDATATVTADDSASHHCKDLNKQCDPATADCRKCPS